MTTAALAAQADVEHALGRSLTDAFEIARCTALILLASNEVEIWTGYRFAPGSYTITRYPDGWLQIQLPGNVATVAAVRDINQMDGTATTLTLTTDYTVRGDLVYLMRDHDCLEIDFTTTAAIPTEVVGVVAGAVAATLAAPAVGTASETAGPYHVSYIPNTGRLWLAAADKLVLGRYRQARVALAILR